MPYKRSYRRPMKTNVISRVKKLEKKVKQIDPEVKHHYRTPEDIVFPNYSPGTLYNLTAIDQGFGPTQRIGNQVRAVSISVRYKIYVSPGNNSQSCRVIFFIDNANTLTAANQILKNVGTVNAVNSPFNDEDKTNFKVLSDKTYPLVAFGGAPSGITARFYKKLNIPVHFEDTTSTVFKNMIKMLLISDVATSVCTFAAAYDFAYTDA